MRTLSEILAADGVTLTYTSEVVGRDHVFHGVFHFEGRTLEHEWSQSVDNPHVEPTVAEIMGPTLRFAMTAENSHDYKDWASEWTSNPDEWMPRETYEAWLDIAKNLRRLLGDERYESYSSNEVEHDD